MHVLWLVVAVRSLGLPVGPDRIAFAFWGLGGSLSSRDYSRALSAEVVFAQDSTLRGLGRLPATLAPYQAS